VDKRSGRSKHAFACINGFSIASAAGNRTLRHKVCMRTSVVGSQRALDSVVVGRIFQSLVMSQTRNTIYIARLLATAATYYSGDWLHAVPISACGVHLNDEATRVAGFWSQI